MDDWDEREDPYKILELDKGSEVTEAEIKKACFSIASLGVLLCAPVYSCAFVRRTRYHKS